MQDQLYPPEIAGDAIESYLAQYPSKGRGIYLIVLLALVGAGALLPILKVDVTVRSVGLIRPVVEKSEIKARVSGLVQEVLVEGRETVQKGQPLLTVQAKALDERADLLHAQLDEKERFLADLDWLFTLEEAGREEVIRRLESSKYRQAYAHFEGELREQRLQGQNAERTLERLQHLYERKAVARQKVEDAAFRLAQERSAAALIVERHRTQWQGDRVAYWMERERLQSELQQIKEERMYYTVKAPFRGTVEQLTSLGAGSYVQAGQRLAVLSPRSELIAEVSVTPQDIGLLTEGAPVRMQIDAFNYNQWGFVTGRVTSIADDFMLVDGAPMFRVGCSIDQAVLVLENGVKGHLRKGMTLQARFFVARRSLFQLLYDDVNNWLNPNQAEA